MLPSKVLNVELNFGKPNSMTSLAAAAAASESIVSNFFDQNKEEEEKSFFSGSSGFRSENSGKEMKREIKRDQEREKKAPARSFKGHQ